MRHECAVSRIDDCRVAVSEPVGGAIADIQMHGKICARNHQLLKGRNAYIFSSQCSGAIHSRSRVIAKSYGCQRGLSGALMYSLAWAQFRPLQLADRVKDHSPRGFCIGEPHCDDSIHSTRCDKFGIAILAHEKLRRLPDFCTVHWTTASRARRCPSGARGYRKALCQGGTSCDHSVMSLAAQVLRAACFSTNFARHFMDRV